MQVLHYSEEKIGLSQQIYDYVDQKIRRLDKDLKNFEGDIARERTKLGLGVSNPLSLLVRWAVLNAAKRAASHGRPVHRIYAYVGTLRLILLENEPEAVACSALGRGACELLAAPGRQPCRQGQGPAAAEEGQSGRRPWLWGQVKEAESAGAHSSDKG